MTTFNFLFRDFEAVFFYCPFCSEDLTPFRFSNIPKAKKRFCQSVTDYVPIVERAFAHLTVNQARRKSTKASHLSSRSPAVNVT